MSGPAYKLIDRDEWAAARAAGAYAGSAVDRAAAVVAERALSVAGDGTMMFEDGADGW